MNPLTYKKCRDIKNNTIILVGLFVLSAIIAVGVEVCLPLLIALIVTLYFFCGFKLLLQFTKDMEERDFISIAFLTGLFLRVICSVVIYYLLLYINGSPFLLGTRGDDYTYDLLGWEMADAWRQDDEYSIPAMMSAYKGYIYFNAIVYFLFGHAPIMVRFLNSIFGAFTIVYVYHIARYVFNEKIARTSAILTIIFPPLILWSNLQYKDTLLTFLVVFSFYHAIKFKERMQWYSIFFIVCSIFVIFSMRIQAAICLGGIIIIYFLISGRKIIVKKTVGLFMASIGILAVVGVLIYKFEYTEYLMNFLFRRAEFQQTRFTQFTSGGANMISLFSKWYLFPIYLVTAAIFSLPTFVSIPSPYHIVDKIFMSGGLIWQLLFPFFCLGIIHCFIHKRREALLLYGWVCLTLIGLFFLFYIMTWRHKIQMLPFCLILIALGMTNFKKYRIFLLAYYLIVFPINIFVFNYLRLKSYGLL